MKNKINVDCQEIKRSLMEHFSSVESIAQLLPILFWIISLSRTRAFYEIYVLIGLLGIIGWFRREEGLSAVFNRSRRTEIIIACVFSVIVLAANYDLFLFISNPYSQNMVLGSIYSILHYFIYLPSVFFGGFFAVFYIILSAEQLLVPFYWQRYRYHLSNKAVFWGAFSVLFVLYATILIVGYYPGALSYDSIEQLEQIISGVYSNHHPIYHTYLIKLFFKLGYSLFNDMNIGVFFYSLFSVALMSFCFAYSLVTLYKLHINGKIVIAILVSYLILPYHIFFSFTMWKDIPFSACVTIFTVSMFRYFNQLWSNRYLCISIILCSALGMGILRTNGLLILIILTVVFAVYFGKKRRKITVALACVTVLSFILMRPVVNSLGIPQPDTIESLSIPAQQIARTVKRNNDIKPEDKELIGRIANIDELKEQYLPYLSDPVKEVVRRSGNQQYLKDHKWEYAMLYIRLGLSHPDSYFMAWVDQTVGYWNAGYNYIRWKTGVYSNQYGIRRKAYSRTLNLSVKYYAETFANTKMARLFLSIGLQTWLIAFIAFIAHKRKDKLTVFLTVPCFAIVLSLMIASPVFSEFRYVYSLFCCLPFLAVIVFRKTSKRMEE